MAKYENDKILIRKLKVDDEKAFRDIYLKYHKELYIVAIKYLRTKDLAEDAVHDVFIKLWNNRSKLNSSGSLSGFLFTAIKNHVINIINTRKRKLKKKIKLSQERRRDDEIQDNVIILSEYRKLYKLAMKELPEARKEVFELRIKEGLTNQEVADYLEISIHTVKSQFYKASKFIREYISIHSDSSDTGT